MHHCRQTWTTRGALCSWGLAAILSTFITSKAVGTALSSPSGTKESLPTSAQKQQLFASLSRLFTGTSSGARERTPTIRQFQVVGNQRLNRPTRRGCWTTQHETLLVPVYQTIRRANTRCYMPRLSGWKRCNTTHRYYRQLTHWNREQRSRTVCCPGWRTTPGEDTCTTRVTARPSPSPTPPTESPLGTELERLKREYNNLKLMLNLERQNVLRIQAELESERSHSFKLKVQLEECRNATARKSGLSDSINSNGNPCLGRSCPGHPTAVCATYGDCCAGQEAILWLDENGDTVECGIDSTAASAASLIA